MRWDGGGSHRLAGPSREQLTSLKRVAEVKVLPCTRQMNHPGRRLDAGPSARWPIEGIALGAHQAGRT